MTPERLIAVVRFVHDAALMGLWGASAYLLALVPSALAAQIARRLAAPRLAAVVLVALTTIAALPTQTALIGDGWPDAVNGTILWDVITSTNIGTSWLAQGLAGLLLLAAQMAAPRWQLAATATASGLGLVCLALSGHAAMNTGWQGIAHPVNDALHVISAGGWVGALLPLLLILSSARHKPFDADSATALRRFSNTGHVIVTLAILSGIANGFFIVGWPPGWSSLYRVLLLIKIVAVLAMVGIAVANRYWFVPRIGRARASAVHAIRVGTAIEIGLALTAILLVSIFGMLDPNS